MRGQEEKNALNSQVAPNVSLEVIFVGMNGSAALAASCVVSSSTQTQTVAKGAQHSGSLEGLGRHRRVSLRFRLLVTAHMPRAGSIHEGGSDASSSARHGPGGQ